MAIWRGIEWRDVEKVCSDSTDPDLILRMKDGTIVTRDGYPGEGNYHRAMAELAYAKREANGRPD